jgi:DivIVA domain-containing protein
MAMTPADVHAQQFTTVRMRTGYDMDEVDAFLDAVEAEITRLLAENDDLRAQLTQAQSRVLAAEQKAAKAPAPPAPAPAPRQGSNVVEVKTPPPAPVATPAAVPAAPPVEATPASEQALRMLELAQRTADETVSSARTEAYSIVSKAKEEARLVTADLDSQRIALEKQVGELRTFERNYRVKLRDHIAGQLAEFDAAVREGSPAVEIPPVVPELVAEIEEPAEITAEQRALPNVDTSHSAEAVPKSEI